MRALTQDDAHIFCTVGQIHDEVKMIMTSIDTMLEATGFTDIQVRLSTRPEKYSGQPELWDKATDALMSALTELGKPFVIQKGEGAFYGPKIEIHIKDSLGRSWQCGTIQLDFVQPENFDLTCINDHGKEERVVVIHQAMYGSLERFMALLLEHHKGNLPLWLAPVQMAILSITDQQNEYVSVIAQLFQDAGYRVQKDTSSDPLRGKIQKAQREKIPCVITVGGKEQEAQTVSIRWKDGRLEHGIPLDRLIEYIKGIFSWKK